MFQHLLVELQWQPHEFPFLSFYNGPYSRFIYLEMTGNAAADLNLWYISSNSTFSCNVMTFLCFLGALSKSLEVPWCYLRLTNIALNTMKMIQDWSLITVMHHLLEKQTAHLEMISVTQRVRWILTWAHPDSNRRMRACSVMSNSLRPHGLQPSRLFCPWDFSRQEY